jgi:hypothetical protein
MLSIANKYLLHDELIELYTTESKDCTLLPCVYVTEISPIKRRFTHKYGVTTKIWDRLKSLRKEKKISNLVRLFIFLRIEDAYNFESSIKAYVWKNGYRKGKNYSNESITIPPDHFADFMRTITQKYLEYDESCVDLFAASAKYIKHANIWLLNSPLYPRVRKLSVHQDLITASILLTQERPRYRMRRRSKSQPKLTYAGCK